MAHQLQDLKVDFVSLVDRAAVRDPQNKSEPRRFLLWKREGAELPTEKGDSMPEDQDLQARLEKAEQDAKEAIEKAEQEREAREKAEAEAKEKADELAKLEAAKPKDGDKGNDEDETEASKAMKAQLEKAEADRVALEKRVSDAEEIAKAERDQRVTGEFITKAEGYNALPIKAAEFGPVLKRAAETLERADFEALDGLLKAANEQIAKGDLFKEMGANNGGGAVLPDSAAAEITRKATELRKADPKMSLIDAEDHVMKDDRELQARYLAEQR